MGGGGRGWWWLSRELQVQGLVIMNTPAEGGYDTRVSLLPTLHGSCPLRICWPCKRLQVWLRGGTHVVAGRIGLHRVLGGQRYAAHGDDHEDAHLEVAQVQDVMAQPAKAEGRAGSRSDPGSRPFLSPQSHRPVPLPHPSRLSSTPGGALGPTVQCS